MRGTKTGGINMKFFRCPNCKKLLFKYSNFADITVEIKCSRCSQVLVTELTGNSYIRIKIVKKDYKGD